MMAVDGLVRKREILQDDTQPPTLLHRDRETEHLVSLLSPLTAGGSADGAFIYGPPGTGKTCTAREVLEHLAASTDVETVEIDCWQNHSRRRALFAILRGLLGSEPVNGETAAPGDLLDRLRDVVDGPTVVMLDEVDQLDDFDVLRDLHGLADVTMLMIANKEHTVFGNLEPGLSSRIGTMTRIEFEPYHDTQLIEILRERVSVGVVSGVVGESDLEEIADAAARDARNAINILRVSLDLAVAREEIALSSGLIEEAAPIARQDIARARLSSVTREQRQTLEALAEIEPAPMGEIYRAYSADVGEKTRRTVGNWLREKFTQYNLVRVDKSENPVRYELTDAAREVI
ncbi:Cdc6/Cdc18 family protein (plasmid) [Natrialbaceae archaeon A-CW2]